MSSQDFVRSSALNNIPSRKALEYISLIQNSESDISKRNIKTTAINRYVESNIPIQYWSLKMEKDFIGDQNLLNKYKEYTSDLKLAYTQGRSICFSGSHGLGKSMTTCCILKKACEKGFTCLYSTLSDIVNVMIQASGEDKFLSRRELMLVDFLVIDEFDSRFIGSDNAADLYARSLETIFRTRSQNKLPTLMCTNSPNIIESFNGPLKQSIESLVKGYLTIFPVFGEDFRKRK